MNRRYVGILVIALMFGVVLAQDVTIRYWQYEFASKVALVDELIEEFQAANPGIRVIHETFPLDGYQPRVAASVGAGEGPDVVNLFYGWLPVWVETGLLEPLPEQYFDAEQIDAAFAPVVQAAKVDGVYYGLPTAVRSLAIFYNQDFFDEVGISEPPTTWDEFIEVAQALTIKRGDRFTRLGFGVEPTGQDHHLLREVLTRQFGTQPYSDDLREVLYDNEAGLAAFRFYTDLITVHEVGIPNFVPGGNYRDGFITQENIAMILDGSFAIGTVRNGAQFNWGVTQLPVGPSGIRANFGSFWMHGLTPRAFRDEAVLEASARFLEFLTSAEVQRRWLDAVGELPALRELIADPELAADPVFGPFIRGLEYATATPFVDESAQRQIMVDAINRVIIEGQDPAVAWALAAQQDQALLDEFNQGR